MPACGQGGAGDQSIVARQFINNFISLSHKEPNSACPCAECARRCQPSRGNLFEEETMANHSKERTQAEAQLKKTQKAQRPPKDRRLCPNMWPLVMPFVQRRHGQENFDLSFPKISSGADSRREAESSHHPSRCLQSCTRSECSSPTCSSRGACLRPRTCFSVINSASHKENQQWGASRIHGELLMLGFEVAQSTVSKYMVQDGAAVAKLEDIPAKPRAGESPPLISVWFRP